MRKALPAALLLAGLAVAEPSRVGPKTDPANQVASLRACPVIGLACLVADGRTHAEGQVGGLGSRELQQATEAALARRSVHFSPSDPFSGRPTLVVDVEFLRIPAAGTVFYHASAAVYQRCVLGRSPAVPVCARTWWRARSGLGDRHAIASTAQELAVTFCHDYLGANPK